MVGVGCLGLFACNACFQPHSPICPDPAMGKISEQLARFLQSSPEGMEATIHVIHRRELNEAEKEAFLHKLAETTEQKPIQDVMPGSGVLIVRTAAQTIPSIADLPEVDWIDLESEASLGDLLD